MPDEMAGGENATVRWDARLACASGLLGVLVALAVMTTDQWLIAALLAGAVLPWAPLVSRAARRRRWITVAAVASLAALGGAVAVRLDQEHPPPPPGSATPLLRFVPPEGPVGHCLTITGTGTIPAGKALVLLDRPTDSAGYDTRTSGYGYDGPAKPSGNGWIAPDLDIGSGEASDNGQHIALVALLVPERALDRLAASAAPNSGALPGDPLSFGVKADRIVIARNADNARCPDQ